MAHGWWAPARHASLTAGNLVTSVISFAGVTLSDSLGGLPAPISELEGNEAFETSSPVRSWQRAKPRYSYRRAMDRIIMTMVPMRPKNREKSEPSVFAQLSVYALVTAVMVKSSNASCRAIRKGSMWPSGGASATYEEDPEVLCD
eukprot:scaffold20358_cov140-Isochrysis_galbana.AAC.1